MSKKILTARTIDAIKPKAKRFGTADGLIPGLQLVTHPSGKKSFILLCRVAGKQIYCTLDGVFTLAEARAEAKRLLAIAARGEDPRVVAQKAAAAAPKSFAVTSKDFVARHAKAHNRDWRKTERLLEREVLPLWGHLPLDSITKADVVALLNGIVDRGVPVQANRTLACVRKLFNWCIENGKLETSPADRVKKPSKETARERALSDGEIALLWRATDTLDYPYNPIFKLLILTGQRRSEVAEMPWSELDPERTLWVIPGTRTKNKVEQHIPIPSAMREILEHLPHIPGPHNYVFTATGQAPPYAFHTAKQDLDAAITALNGGTSIAPWRPHDLRRSMVTTMARLGVALPTCEKILNHISGTFSGVQGIYQRHTFRAEMAAALELWANHVLGLAHPEPGVLRVVASR